MFFLLDTSSESIGKNDKGEEITVENVLTVSKRQTNFQNNNFDQVKTNNILSKKKQQKKYTVMNYLYRPTDTYY